MAPPFLWENDVLCRTFCWDIPQKMTVRQKLFLIFEPVWHFCVVSLMVTALILTLLRREGTCVCKACILYNRWQRAAHLISLCILKSYTWASWSMERWNREEQPPRQDSCTQTDEIAARGLIQRWWILLYDE
jgi:hypothetical protein